MANPLDTMQIRTHQYRRYDPVSNTYGKVRKHGHQPHQGWDLAAPVGTPVKAVADGFLWQGKPSKGYGLSLVLEFTTQGQTLYAFYAHLKEITARVPCRVTEGEIIARSGRDGAESIPVSESHLHFEIRTAPYPGRELTGRIDPGEVLGYQYYTCPL